MPPPTSSATLSNSTHCRIVGLAALQRTPPPLSAWPPRIVNPASTEAPSSPFRKDTPRVAPPASMIVWATTSGSSGSVPVTVIGLPRKSRSPAWVPGATTMQSSSAAATIASWIVSKSPGTLIVSASVDGARPHTAAATAAMPIAFRITASSFGRSQRPPSKRSPW